jgi:hypothetical protein
MVEFLHSHHGLDKQLLFTTFFNLDDFNRFIDVTCYRDYSDIPDASMIAIVCTPLGAFGNSIYSICSIVALALSLGVRQIFLPEKPYLASSAVICGISIQTYKDSSKVYDALVDYIVLKGSFFSLPAFSAILPGHPLALGETLVPLLSFKTFHRPLDRNHLVIHIRSGDVFKSNHPHPGYGQPPLAFYEKIVQSFGWEQITIVCEDTLNPVIDALHTLVSSHYPAITINIRHGQSLEDDICFMLAAVNLVGGRGSFIPSIAVLSPNISTLYLWHSDNQGLGIEGITLFLLRDKSGSFTAKCLSQNWANTDEQTSAMLNYPIDDIEISEQ